MRRWNWYQFVYTLADGQFYRFPEVTKMNFIHALTHKAFELENPKITQYYATYRYTGLPSK